MKLMQIFGIGPELLQGGNSSAPYASGALNRELLTQMLTTYQVSLKRFLRERMEVVAERQGHFEFEKRGTSRVPVYETWVLQDEMTGEEYTEVRPKLAIPEVNLRVMNLRDETVERQFLMDLKNMGVPVSDGALMVNVPIEFDEEVTRLQAEKMDKTLAELHYQKRLFTAIFVNHLPIPPEYIETYMQYLQGMQTMALMMPGTDITDGTATPNLFPMVNPSMNDLTAAENAEGVAAGGQTTSAESQSGKAGAPRKAHKVNTPEGVFIKQAREQTGYYGPLHATPEMQQEFTALGEEEWSKKYGLSTPLPVADVNPTQNTEDSIDKTASVDVDFTLEVPDDFDMDAAIKRVSGIRSLASPDHMRLRRKMMLPEGTMVKESTLPEYTERVQDESDGDNGVEGEGGVLGDND
jgi:hypothetical protein